jgi:RNA polymerase sigma factor (sigma-70 family)
MADTREILLAPPLPPAGLWPRKWPRTMKRRMEPAAGEGEILSAMERGDHTTALRLLMRDHGTAIYRYCRQMVEDADLADEAHQMTFVQAYEGLPKFAGRSSLRTWLFGIARHRCLDLVKITRRRRKRFQLMDELPDQPAPAETAEEHLAARSRISALGQCLRELAPHVRTAVLLRFQQGVTYEEMARLEEERPATLQARVVRALPVLRRCLERKGAAP